MKLQTIAKNYIDTRLSSTVKYNSSYKFFNYKEIPTLQNLQ